MDAGLDTGGILLKRETEIGENETTPDLMERLSFLGADLLSETLAMHDELVPQPQDDSLATFAPIMRKEDGLMDWKWSARDIANRVRGFQPFPTAFTYYHGKKLTLWKAAVAENSQDSPGKIMEAKGDNFLVSCGSGVLKIDELQIEGKRRMQVRDFLNGSTVQAGEVLG
jgi:methionyl-tRNA formyltransferase